MRGALAALTAPCGKPSVTRRLNAPFPMLRLLLALLMTTPTVSARSIDWQTPAEASDFRETATVEEVNAYLARLDGLSESISVASFGRSGEGREMPVLIAAKGIEHTAAAARASGRPIVLLQAGIHPGENEGKDALLMLVRDLVRQPAENDALEKLILVVVPIYNIDGEARRGPFNRINQLGPESMGWRTTARNLNLNRDFIKADAPESRAWLALWGAWRPHLLIDLHNTDGADFQYDSTWILADGPRVPPALAQWQKNVLVDGAFAHVQKQGFKLAPYVQLVDDDDPRKGLAGFIATPRYSTGYALAHARPGLTVENHMLKSNERRVEVSLALLRAILVEIARVPSVLPAAIAKAEEQARASMFAPEGYPLELKIGTESRDVDFLGVEYTRTLSEISGQPWIQYHPDKPVEFSVPVFDAVEVVSTATLPAGWLIPPEWTDVIERLALHGIESTVLGEAHEIEADFERAAKVVLSARSFEGRQTVSEWALEPVRRSRTFAAGSVLVVADQPLAVLAAELLQAGAPDSFARWGFFNAVFEDKEYFEARVMEKLAREMLASKPELRAEFETALADPAFAGDRNARLRWFYDKSEWADPRRNVIPVARLDAAGLARLR